MFGKLFDEANTCLLGQVWVLQAGFMDDEPGQESPPYCGAGLLQLRVMGWVPPPHVTEQGPVCQLLHCPWTTKKHEQRLWVQSFKNLIRIYHYD